MKNQRCPKCSAPRRSGSHYECDSRQLRQIGEYEPQHTQSIHCRERCKVAKLKKQVEKLKKQLKDSEIVSATFDPKSWELTCTRGDGMTTFLVAKHRRDR